jgi:hypothetical protein
MRSLTPDELASPDEALLRVEYDSAIRDKLGGPLSPEEYRDDPDFGGFDMDTPSYDAYDAYEDERNPSESMPDADDAREETPDTYDQYVGASVNVPIGDEIRT